MPSLVNPFVWFYLVNSSIEYHLIVVYGTRRMVFNPRFHVSVLVPRTFRSAPTSKHLHVLFTHPTHPSPSLANAAWQCPEMDFRNNRNNQLVYIDTNLWLIHHNHIKSSLNNKTVNTHKIATIIPPLYKKKREKLHYKTLLLFRLVISVTNLFS